MLRLRGNLLPRMPLKGALICLSKVSDPSHGVSTTTSTTVSVIQAASLADNILQCRISERSNQNSVTVKLIRILSVYQYNIGIFLYILVYVIRWCHYDQFIYMLSIKEGSKIFCFAWVISENIWIQFTDKKIFLAQFEIDEGK